MSGASNTHQFSFVGVAADIEITLPFKPGFIDFYVENAGGTATVHGHKTSRMTGDTYLSMTNGEDAGVEIDDNVVTISNGADINVVGKTCYAIAHDNYQDA